MAEDFAKLLRLELGNPHAPLNTHALALCNVLTRYFERERQHIADLQQTATKAYEKASALEKV